MFTPDMYKNKELEDFKKFVAEQRRLNKDITSTTICINWANGYGNDKYHKAQVTINNLNREVTK